MTVKQFKEIMRNGNEEEKKTIPSVLAEYTLYDSRYIYKVYKIGNKYFKNENWPLNKSNGCYKIKEINEFNENMEEKINEINALHTYYS